MLIVMHIALNSYNMKSMYSLLVIICNELKQQMTGECNWRRKETAIIETRPYTNQEILRQYQSQSYKQPHNE